MKAASFCFDKKIVRQKSKHAAFHPGPILPPGGEGSPLRAILERHHVELSLKMMHIRLLQHKPFKLHNDSASIHVNCLIPKLSFLTLEIKKKNITYFPSEKVKIFFYKIHFHFLNLILKHESIERNQA